MQNLNKDVPNEEVKYPPDTASKNRYPDVIPGKCAVVRLSKELTIILPFKQLQKNKHGHSVASLVLEVDWLVRAEKFKVSYGGAKFAGNDW